MKGKSKAFIIIFICILVVSILLYLRNYATTHKRRSVIEEKEYIYSEEIDEGTFSPSLIHVPISVYEGDVAPQAFTKSCYLFITKYIPEFHSKCIDSEKTKKYYNNNQNELKKILGINNLDDFKGVIEVINQLNGKLKYESSRFIMNEVYTDNNGVEANLYIKYEDNPEIRFVMRVSKEIQELHLQFHF